MAAAPVAALPSISQLNISPSTPMGASLYPGGATFREAFNRGDLDAAANCFAEDCQNHGDDAAAWFASSVSVAVKSLGWHNSRAYVRSAESEDSNSFCLLDMALATSAAGVYSALSVLMDAGDEHEEYSSGRVDRKPWLFQEDGRDSR